MDRFSEVSQIFPHFALKSREREVKSPCFYYVWWALHIPPKMSDSLQRNIRQIWESAPSNSWVFGRTSWVDSEYLIGRESGYLKFFFTFLEVNMSNILWSMCICKRTFFPVCRMSGYVNTLVYFYLAPYSRQER